MGCVVTAARDVSATAPERALCVLCDHREACRDALTCRTCRRRLADDVEALQDGYLQLDPMPTTGGGHAGARAPGFGSKSPARDDVLSLQDRRGYVDPDRPGALVGVPVVLASWRSRLADAGYGPGLDRESVDQFARTWWEIDGFALAIRGALHRVRRANGELEDSIPIGECPRAIAVLGDDDEVTGTAPCRGEIRAKAYGQTATCSRCHWSWRGEPELRQLGGQLGDAWMDVAAISRYFGEEVKVGTLRQWARRDGWERQQGEGLHRALYRLRDARMSWHRAHARRNPMFGPTRADWEVAQREAA